MVLTAIQAYAHDSCEVHARCMRDIRNDYVWVAEKWPIGGSSGAGNRSGNGLSSIRSLVYVWQQPGVTEGLRHCLCGICIQSAHCGERPFSSINTRNCSVSLVRRSCGAAPLVRREAAAAAF